MWTEIKVAMGAPFLRGTMWAAILVMTVLIGIFFGKRIRDAVLWPMFFVARWLARRYILFVEIPEGFALLIVKGGAFVRAEIQWRGRTLDRKTWDVVPDGTKKSGRTWREPSHPFGGIRWLGFQQQVYMYHLRWSSPHTDGNIVSHDQDLTLVMLKDHVYYITGKGLEDKDNIPVDFGFLVTSSCTNPYKFVFRVQDVLEVMANSIAAHFASYVGTKSWEEIAGEKSVAEEALWSELQARGVIDGLRKGYGMSVSRLMIKDITPPADAQRRAQAKWEAEQDAKVVAVRAAAERDRVQAVYGVLATQGDFGRFIRLLEALEATPAGVLTVHAIPGLADLFKGNDVAGLQRQISELRQMLQRAMATKPAAAPPPKTP